MTNEEKNKDASKRFDNLPLCECGDPGVVEDSFVSTQFRCGNKNEVRKPIDCSCELRYFVCNFLCAFFAGWIMEVTL